MKVAINLLPAVYRRQALLRRRIAQWSLVLCTVLAATWAARWYKVGEYHTLSRQLEAVSREGRPAQAMLHEITEMRQRVQQLKRHQTIAQELDHQRYVLALLGAVSKAARQTNGRLHVVDCHVVDLQAAENNKEQEADAERHASVTLVGVSLDSPTVGEFEESLLRSGMFADVKLIKSNERADVGQELYDYEVRCEL
jgi:hypothetical protein